MVRHRYLFWCRRCGTETEVQQDDPPRRTMAAAATAHAIAAGWVCDDHVGWLCPAHALAAEVVAAGYPESAVGWVPEGMVGVARDYEEMLRREEAGR